MGGFFNETLRLIYMNHCRSQGKNRTGLHGIVFPSLLLIRKMGKTESYKKSVSFTTRDELCLLCLFTQAH
jgi:hypothetical protein